MKSTLRINHTGSQVEAVFEGDGPRHIERRPFSFTLTPQEAEDIRWYLEDYRIYPIDPAPRIAKRIEQRMAEVGRELFRLLLAGSDVWESLRHNLADTRIEVETEIEDALVPWELLRDPVANLPLALQVSSFVRCHSRPALKPNSPNAATGKIRVLLAICRLEDDHVPFRSVARHLIRGLTDSAREPFQLEVLRPPTFEQLAKTLRAAKAQGEPFHAVHFDGHGLSGEVFFENPKLKRNAQSVSAAELGKILHETHVPLLILNACRSADNEPPEQPKSAGDLHQQIRQFGSFAHAVMDYGASGVVAWRYSVFVDTAARYIADLYGALASGLPLGEAATLARKQLSNTTGREIEDWVVPIVFEAWPIQLFPTAKDTFEIKLQVPATAESGLPQAPDIGFIGRDETVLRLDRTFDEQNIILLHAYAGSGKSSTASEFVRWYRQTGFLGRVLFTSFEQHRPLPRVLDELGRIFENALAKSGIQWLTLDDAQRRGVALQLLQQVPVLWIWDNIEPIGGFPAGTPSAWSGAEQNDLLDFLRSARGTKAKFLLTSRRDERGWLHDFPARVELPPMPFEECVEMTEELAKKRGRRLDEVEDWRPLLRFTQGNPLTLTVLVGQALRDGLRTREHIASFVHKLQAGESVFEDEVREGRTRSLAASLSYGFENAFTEAERKQLALLHLFQGFVDVGVLRLIGNPEAEWCLPEVKGLTREVGIGLLDRAHEVGLLTVLGGGLYRIHPALPWFVRRLFEQYYPDTGIAAIRAFVEAVGLTGDYYADLYASGNRDAIAGLTVDEANLLRAQTLARINGWHCVIGTMQGLRVLYEHTGRLLDWSRLVEEFVPYCVDPVTDGPLIDKEADWVVVTQYRSRLAREERHLEKAERLQRLVVNWTRERMRPFLAKPQESWDAQDKSAIRQLAASLGDLSAIQLKQGSASCVDGYQEALFLAERVGDRQAAAGRMFNLGKAYQGLAEIRDLVLADKWYRRSLVLCGEEDHLSRAGCFTQLGSLAYDRFLDAKGKGRLDECIGHLANAELSYKQALEMVPTNAIRELVTIHNQLAIVYFEAGETNTALRCIHESIRQSEAMQDRFRSGQTRRNAAIALAQSRRLGEAREWAQSALRDFEACENAEEHVVNTLKLLERIESDLRATSPPS